MTLKTALCAAGFLAVFTGCGAANALTTLNVNYTASSGGTPITIGNVASPQYDFVLGTFFNGDAQYKLVANSGSTVAFPDNGVPQTPLTAVTTRLEGVTFTNGNYQLAFDIGAVAYTGFATVSNDGRLIDTIRYQPVSAGAVPEPSTWIIMLMGIGGLGMAARRRRIAQPVSTAR